MLLRCELGRRQNDEAGNQPRFTARQARVCAAFTPSPHHTIATSNSRAHLAHTHISRLNAAVRAGWGTTPKKNVAV